jgi:hypothetical protein
VRRFNSYGRAFPCCKVADTVEIPSSGQEALKFDTVTPRTSSRQFAREVFIHEVRDGNTTRQRQDIGQEQQHQAKKTERQRQELGEISAVRRNSWATTAAELENSAHRWDDRAVAEPERIHRPLNVAEAC